MRHISWPVEKAILQSVETAQVIDFPAFLEEKGRGLSLDGSEDVKPPSQAAAGSYPPFAHHKRLEPQTRYNLVGMSRRKFFLPTRSFRNVGFKLGTP